MKSKKNSIIHSDLNSTEVQKIGHTKRLHYKAENMTRMLSRMELDAPEHIVLLAPKATDI